MNAFKSHKPGFMTGFDEPDTLFETKDQLMNDLQIKRFQESGAVFSISETRLMGTFPDGKFFVCGTFSEPIPEDWFPQWVAPKERLA